MPDNVYEPGNRIRLSGAFDDAGEAADPTTVTLKVKDPSGDTATYTYPTNVTKDAVGRYHFDVDPAEIGRWFYRWIGSGTLVASAEESFRVRQVAIP